MWKLCFMKTIDKTYESTLEVKQSKFIAVLTPWSDFDATLETLKTKHPKARHFVVAYRYLNEHEQIVEYSSDDGEPKGTSGRPSLFVLAGAELVECGVIIVRYFGGTKLGTGGLVRAYSDSVNQVISEAVLFEYKVQHAINIEFEHAITRRVIYECEEENINIIKRDFGVNARFTLESTQNKLDDFLKKMQREVNVV